MPANDLLLRAVAKERGVPYESLATDPVFGRAYADATPVVPQEDLLTPAWAVPQGTAPQPDVAPVATSQPVEQPAAAPVVAPVDPAQAAPVPPEPVEQAPQTTMQTLGSAVSDLDAIAQEQYDATNRLGDAEANAAEAKANLSQAHAKEAEDIATEWGSREGAADEVVRRTQDEYRKLNEDVAKLPPISDSRTPGQRAWAVLAVAIGGWADAWSSKPTHYADSAREAINQAVTRDIALQQKRLENAKDNRDAKLTELGIARQYLGDTQESMKFALGLRKERFAAEIEAAGSTLTSQTARDRALTVANGFKVEAKKEQMDALQTILRSKQAIVQAVQLGLIDKNTARAQLAATDGDGAQPQPPSSNVAGPLTKTQAGAVNLSTHQNTVPGLTWLVDPSVVSKEDREAAQKIKSANDRVVATINKAKQAYEMAADPKLSDADRLSALARYRTLVESQLPGFVSQATGSGTPQEGEAQRLLRSLPPAPVINDVGGVRQGLQSLENWRNDRTMDPRAFKYFADDFGDIVNSGLESYKARLGGPTAQPAEAAPPAKPASGNAPRFDPAKDL